MNASPAVYPSYSVERKAVTQITDMVGYSTLTAAMSPVEIRDFIIDYQRQLEGLILEKDCFHAEFTPMAGDSSVTVYPLGKNQGEANCPLHAAIRIGMAVQKGSLLPTRLGMYAGNVIDASFDEHTLSFGNAFAAAARLEQLCNYFRTWILFDREVARSDNNELANMVSIGKVTPKNFLHPIHVYTIYKPGINNCPLDIDIDGLHEFIALKNEAMDYFTGNSLKDICCNFPLAHSKLKIAAEHFKKLTGKDDLPTCRLLEYIEKHPSPTDEFHCNGMIINYYGSPMGDRQTKMPEKLLLALDLDLYQTLVCNTEWEEYFQLDWHRQGELIINLGEIPDGVYFIESGQALVKDSDGNVITRLREGEIFGEMAYFSIPSVRTAQVVAATDLVLRKISGEDFSRFPELRKVFDKIATKRLKAQGCY